MRNPEMVEYLSYPYIHVPAFNTDQIKKKKKKQLKMATNEIV